MERQIHLLTISNLAVLGLVGFVALMWLAFMIEARWPTRMPTHVIERNRRIAERRRAEETTGPAPDRERDSDG